MLEPPQIIDNGDTVFSLAGTWEGPSFTSGYLGDHHRSDAGSVADVATWTFTLLVFRAYDQVAATWPTPAIAPTTNAPFQFTPAGGLFSPQPPEPAVGPR